MNECKLIHGPNKFLFNHSIWFLNGQQNIWLIQQNDFIDSTKFVF